MDLSELGGQYSAQARLIRHRIHTLRSQMQNPRGDSCCELNTQLRCLYEMALDCENTAHYLMNYYDRR